MGSNYNTTMEEKLEDVQFNRCFLLNVTTYSLCLLSNNNNSTFGAVSISKFASLE